MAGEAGPSDLDGHIYQRLLKERIVFLGSEVRDSNSNAICAQMLLLNAEDPQADIFLYINSPGGSVDSGMAIYDTMQFISNDVATFGGKKLGHRRRRMEAVDVGRTAETTIRHVGLEGREEEVA